MSLTRKGVPSPAVAAKTRRESTGMSSSASTRLHSTATVHPTTGYGAHNTNHVMCVLIPMRIYRYQVHKAWPSSADDNSVFRAVLLAVRQMMQELQDLQEAPRWHLGAPHVGIWEAMVSAFRVRRSPTELGDPGPEGVHQVWVLPPLLPSCCLLSPTVHATLTTAVGPPPRGTTVGLGGRDYDHHDAATQRRRRVGRQ